VCVCVCVYIYIYICVCVCVYIYIYKTAHYPSKYLGTVVFQNMLSMIISL